MKFVMIIRPASQVEVLRDARKVFARPSNKHRNKKAYRRHDKHKAKW